MVEHGRLGGAGGAGVVMARDRSAAARRARRRPSSLARSPRWTWPSRRPSSVGAKTGGATELARPADVVDERSREQQVARGAADGAAQARGRASPRRPCARAARRRTSGGRRESPGTPRSGASASARATIAAQPVVVHLRDQELEETVELVGVSTQTPASVAAGSTPSAGSSVRTSTCSWSRKRSTRPSTRTASPAANRPSSSSTSFQTRAAMRPLGSTSSSARYARAVLASAAAPCARPRRCPRRCGSPRAPRSWSQAGVSHGGYRGPRPGWRSHCARADASTRRAPSRATGSPTASVSLSQAAVAARSCGILADVSPHDPSMLEVRTGRRRVRHVPTSAVIAVVPAEQLLVVARGSQALPDRRRDLSLRLRWSGRVLGRALVVGMRASCLVRAELLQLVRQAWTHGSPVVARTSRRGGPRRRGWYGQCRGSDTGRSARSATTRLSQAGSTSLVAPPYDVISAGASAKSSSNEARTTSST